MDKEEERLIKEFESMINKEKEERENKLLDEVEKMYETALKKFKSVVK